MGFSYHAEQWLPYPVEAVFAFFTDPENLPELMPEWQQARIEKTSLVPPPNTTTLSAASVCAGKGTRVTLSFRPVQFLPFRVHWEAEITEYSRNNQFCDRQVHGPFAEWYHCHRVRAIDRQGIDMTLIVDHLEYELPFGFLGKLVHRLFLRQQIEDTFNFRQSQLARIFAKIPSASHRRQRQQKSA